MSIDKLRPVDLAIHCNPRYPVGRTERNTKFEAELGRTAVNSLAEQSLDKYFCIDEGKSPRTSLLKFRVVSFVNQTEACHAIATCKDVWLVYNVRVESAVHTLLGHKLRTWDVRDEDCWTVHA